MHFLLHAPRSRASLYRPIQNDGLISVKKSIYGGTGVLCDGPTRLAFAQIRVVFWFNSAVDVEGPTGSPTDKAWTQLAKLGGRRAVSCHVPLRTIHGLPRSADQFSTEKCCCACALFLRCERPFMSVETPVVLILYKRPDLTATVFSAIAKVQPRRLFLVADGPSYPSELEKCHQARSIFQRVDWDC